MNNCLLLVLILISYPFPLSDPQFKNEFIIWNIGQGQWTTWSSLDSCIHFDIGGEKIPWKKIMDLCQQKNNKIFFSHKDKDHTQWAYELFRRSAGKTCLLTPITSPPYPEKFKKIPQCEDKKEFLSWQKLHPPQNIKIKDSNFHSEVILYKKFLLTGDSDQKAEKYWVPNLKNKTLIKVLLLGHHGSKTSTSNQLLNNLTELSQCISSSRKARYGHPNKETLDRIKLKKCPHLSTEQWGHIHFIY
jgi:competence protein ComEC